MFFADVGRDIEQFVLAAVEVVHQFPFSGTDGAGGAYTRTGRAPTVRVMPVDARAAFYLCPLSRGRKLMPSRFCTVL
mgnify:CR=1 FL=1